MAVALNDTWVQTWAEEASLQGGRVRVRVRVRPGRRKPRCKAAHDAIDRVRVRVI